MYILRKTIAGWEVVNLTYRRFPPIFAGSRESALAIIDATWFSNDLRIQMRKNKI